MPNKDRATHPPPEEPGDEGWLVGAEQSLLCQCKADSATVPRSGVRCSPLAESAPIARGGNRRRMIRHNAIEDCDMMLKTGWRRCSPPVH